MPLIDDYIRYIATVRRYSVRTQAVYRDVLTRFSAFAAEDGSDASLLEALTPRMIRGYEVQLLDAGSLGARTVNLHLSVLSGFCRYLLREGKLSANPVNRVARPKQEKRLPVFYREDAMRGYLEETAADAGEDTLSILRSYGPREGWNASAEALYRRRLHRCLLNTLYCTGIRRAELLSLTVGSVDFGRRVLSVHGKGDKMREIPLVPSICQELSLYLHAVESMEGGRRSADAPLFVTEKGHALYPVYVDRVVKDEFQDARGFTGRKSPHVLRHTLATGLLDGGTDLNSIKEMLGHASLAATQVYTHSSVERLKKVYVNAHPRAKSGGKDD